MAASERALYVKNGITLPPHQNYHQDDEIQHHRCAKIYVINGKTKMSQMHFCICERHHTKDYQITVVASVFEANNWNSYASQ